MAFSCAADESGMSEKSILRRVRCTLAARPPSDDPDRFRIATSPECVCHHEHGSAGASTKPQKPRLRRRVLQVWTVERLGIEEDGHGVIERDAVLRRVGLGLSRVPLEHVFSIYEMCGPTGTPGGTRAVVGQSRWSRSTSTNTTAEFREGKQFDAQLATLVLRHWSDLIFT